MFSVQTDSLNSWFTDRSTSTVIVPFSSRSWLVILHNLLTYETFESFWQSQKFSVGRFLFFLKCSPPKQLQCFKHCPPPPPLPTHPGVFKPSAALAQPTKPVVPLRVPGAAGTAEAGVVRVGAKSGVNYQLTVGELRLVHAFRRHINACNTEVKDI